MSRLRRLSEWAAGLAHEDIPGRVRELAASQILSQLAAIRAGAAHPLGAKLVDAFGSPTQDDRAAAAAVLAGLGSWLNLDDTAYAGHLSNSTVAVPVAFSRDGDGAALVTAVVTANECAARLTAAATLGPLRGQSALHTHLAGTVAGRLKCEGADADVWTDAFALAFAMPNWPLMRAFLASDARLLCTLTPVRAANDACAAARAGLRGADDIIEHPDGFLARFATVPLPDLVDHRLGERWHTETLSFKLHPGGPGIDAAIDVAAELGPFLAEEIADVLVEASAYTLLADKTSRRYIAGADSALGALVLNVAYPVATALLTGHFLAADLERPASADPARWAVAERVRLAHDPAMTRALFASDAPFGEALRHAGTAGEPWLRSFGGDELVALAAGAEPTGDFAQAIKATPARVTVRLTDGRTVSAERAIPLGAAGPDTRERHAWLIREKFISVGGSAEVAGAAVKLDSMSVAELREWLATALF
ncbi:MmgE/PrpD family protein [Actinokineospora iranica]|uniref:2-methylcitrate dehydratase PrpD n=1 Tax=Actinokineospora iranica TaxID=1271860 RepID=A0A1G6SLV1_9PSEU|nr:MmgE/PrpD family protein [Actinokineospora iranica]SDD17818.1 2-methylcitrate dehydratase PrpD [Actinokineospora iranica]